MARYGTWVAYQGGGRFALAGVLLLISCLVFASGSRIRRPLQIPQAKRRTVIAVLVTSWVVALLAFFTGFAVYAKQEIHDYPQMTAPSTPILPVTLAAAVVTAVLIGTRTSGTRRGRIANALIGAAVAPMIFELPFDLVVMQRTYPPVLPHPALYRAVFFGPLFLVELTTIACLSLAPGAVLSRVAVQTYGVMLMVFAGWALTGFGFPSTPAAFTFNASSKLLAFLAMVGLFFPHWLAGAVSNIRRRVHGSHNSHHSTTASSDTG
jgi:hypothetical protein